MTTSFSWSDTVQIAFSSCLPCLTSRNSDAASASTDSLLDPDRNNPTAHRIPRARPDELQGLLLPRVDPDTDTDAERMSLHSNPSGRSTWRGGAVKSTKTKKKKKKKASTTGGGSQKRITVLGYNLFGKRAGVPPPIYLPESDDDGESEGESTSALAAPLERTRSSSSGSTFDSDAAPLDLAAIENLTGSSSAIAAAAREEEERRLREEKAERRARRREKREMKRLARTLEGGEGFEGFPGSTGVGSHGSYHRGMPSFEGYGPFVSAQSPGPTQLSLSHQQLRPNYRDDDDGVNGDEDGDADLDGQVYARRSRDPGYGSRSGSDSRSRTSATSRSDGPTPVAPGFPGIASGAGQGFQPPPSPGMLAPGQKNVKSSKSKSSTSSNTSRSKLKSTSSTASDHTSRGTRSNTSASTSQSPSLPSPTSVTFGLGVSPPPPPPEGGPHGYAPTFSKLSAGHGVGGHEDDAFDGSQGLTDADMPPSSPGFRIEGGGGGGGFPSSGLGLGLGRGPRHGRGGDSILEKGGAFLATRGGANYAG